MSEKPEAETSTPSKEGTDQTTSTTPSQETTSTTSDDQTKPSLLNQDGAEGAGEAGAAEGAGKEGGEGAGKPSAEDDFTPLTPTDITLPEGVEADEALMKNFLELVNEAKLPKEAAQKLVDLQTSAMQKASESISQAWSEMQEQWRKEAQELPDFGGDNLPKTTAHISRLIEGFGGNAEEQKTLRQVFDFTGAGNNPQVIAFLGRIAKELVTEGAPNVGAATSQKPATNLAERMFPDLPSGRG